MSKVWGGYAAVMAVLVAGLIWLWAAPVSITLLGTRTELQCTPLLGATNADVNLIPYDVELNEWVDDIGYTDTENAFSRALAGALDACDAARTNRATGVQVAAIGIGTVGVIGFVFAASRRREGRTLEDG